MSRHCKSNVMPMVMPQQQNNCICSLPTLIILILIVLQFSKKKGNDYDKYDCEDEDGYEGHGKQIVDNGILFIIALFYLSCVGCGKGYGAY